MSNTTTSPSSDNNSKKERLIKKASMTFDVSSKICITNLNPQTTKEEVTRVFSEIGPIDNCFILTRNGQSTGTAFLHYATKSNANEAIKKLNQSTLDGKAIIVEYARPRQNTTYKDKKEEKAEKDENEEKEEKEEKQEKEEKEKKKSQQDPRVFKELAIKKRVLILTGLTAEQDEVWIVSNLKKHGHIQSVIFPNLPDKSTANVLFQHPGFAHKALGTLRNSSPKVTATLASFAPVRTCRIFIKNLPFQYTEEKVRALFEPIGTILEVQMGKGFAFVNFSNNTETKKAVEGKNGSEVEGREISVSFALPKEKFNKKGNEEDEEEEGDKDEDEENDDDDDDEDEDEGEEDGDEDKKKDKQDKDKNKNKNKNHNRVEDLEKTLFVRNIAVGTTKQAMKDKFSEFGAVEYCMFTKDEKGEFKGTAFVKFASKDSVLLCLQSANPAKLSDKKRGKKGKANEESDIVVNGRRLIISPALNREQLEKQKEERSKKKKKEDGDARNLHLADVGVIKPGSKEAKELNPVELKMWVDAWNDKKMKLANPNFHVSQFRLSVRPLPVGTTEAELKRVFMEAAAEGVKEGTDTSIKQVKICKIKNPKTGEMQSAKFGFVEFETHDAALAALLNTNNIAGLFGQQSKRLMVEFAIQNVLKLLKAGEVAMYQRMRRPLPERLANEQARQNSGGNTRKLSRSMSADSVGKQSQSANSPSQKQPRSPKAPNNDPKQQLQQQQRQQPQQRQQQQQQPQQQQNQKNKKRKSANFQSDDSRRKRKRYSENSNKKDKSFDKLANEYASKKLDK